MADSTQNQLIAEVTRDLISQVAPQERALFKSISERYFQNPEQVLADQPSKDELLGFGIGEAVELITPIALAVSADVIKFLYEEAKNAMKGESADLINARVRSWFGKLQGEKKKEKESVTPLTTVQLGQVRKIVLEKTKQLKLSEKNRKLLADAIVGDLAISK